MLQEVNPFSNHQEMQVLNSMFTLLDNCQRQQIVQHASSHCISEKKHYVTGNHKEKETDLHLR